MSKFFLHKNKIGVFEVENIFKGTGGLTTKIMPATLATLIIFSGTSVSVYAREHGNVYVSNVSQRVELFLKRFTKSSLDKLTTWIKVYPKISLGICVGSSVVVSGVIIKSICKPHEKSSNVYQEPETQSQVPQADILSSNSKPSLPNASVPTCMLASEIVSCKAGGSTFDTKSVQEELLPPLPPRPDAPPPPPLPPRPNAFYPLDTKPQILPSAVLPGGNLAECDNCPNPVDPKSGDDLLTCIKNGVKLRHVDLDAITKEKTARTTQGGLMNRVPKSADPPKSSGSSDVGTPAESIDGSDEDDWAPSPVQNDPSDDKRIRDSLMASHLQSTPLKRESLAPTKPEISPKESVVNSAGFKERISIINNANNSSVDESFDDEASDD